MAGARLTLDFYHDVVCGWCFNLSPRLRLLAEEFDLDIHHRTFVLQDSRPRMIEAFGSLPQAKEIILGHWEACKLASDTPERFNIKGMRAANFDYPHGLPGALACKAAEQLGGSSAHWDMFDAIQKAHIEQARNVADIAELVAIAQELGHDGSIVASLMQSMETRRQVELDRKVAQRLRVTSVPSVVVRETGARLINGPLEDLRAQISANIRLVA